MLNDYTGIGRQICYRIFTASIIDSLITETDFFNAITDYMRSKTNLNNEQNTTASAEIRIDFLYSKPLKMVKSLLVIFSLMFLNVGFCQSDLIKNQLSVQKQNSFSKSLKIITSSSVMESINEGKSLTIFLPSDYALNNVNEIIVDKLFNQKDINSIEMFFKKNSIEGFWDSNKLLSHIDAGQGTFSLTNRNNDKYIFSKNGQLIMITTPSGFEVNIEESLIVNNTIVYFLDGLLK
jgi:uncharacterized surface protein with fasciclin (FAS1) repeats